MLRVLTLFVLVAAIAGCGTGVAQQAGKLENDVAQYQQAQQGKIDTLNRQYRSTYASLVANLATREKEQRELLFNEDSQRIADQLIADWPKNTQPTQLRGALSVGLSSQVQRVQASDDELAAQKAAYALSFQLLSTQLKKLDEARSNLHVLAGVDQLDENMQLLLSIVVATGEDLFKKYQSSQGQGTTPTGAK